LPPSLPPSTGYILLNEPPQADGNGPYNGIVGEIISFIGSNSIDPDGEIVRYLWDFGDGTTEIIENPEHIYEFTGTYTVELLVEDNEGLTNTYITTCTIIEKNNLPIPILNGPYYEKIGNPLEFDSSGSYDPDGSIIEYLWEFGDGITSTEETPIHIYTKTGEFDVKLTVYDDKGSKKTSITKAFIKINIPPNGEINGPYYGEYNQKIEFTSIGSSDEDGEIIEFQWNFGDGSYSFQEHPSHIYSEAKEYTVILTVTDNDGAIDSTETFCLIKENKAPIVDHNGPYIGVVNEVINLESTGTFDPDGVIKLLEWDFGDGIIEKSDNPTHIYHETGIYTIKLTAIDENGKSSTGITQILITEKTQTTKLPLFTIIAILSTIAIFLLRKKFSSI
jgi:PKD repeat protein